MKVYLEAVDPEERNLRKRKLLDASGKILRASKMAMDHGNTDAAERLFLKSRRAVHIANRDKPAMKLHRATAHAKPTLPGKQPKVDPETRAIRRFKLVSYGNRMLSVGKIAKAAGNESSKFKRMAMRGRRAIEIAKAYSGDQKAKNHWKNVHRDDVRALSRGPRKQTKKKSKP